MIGVAQDFGRPLGRGVGLQRPVAGVGLHKRDLRRVAVDGRSRGEDEVAHAANGPRRVEHILRAVQVNVDVQIGQLHGIAHAGHRRQVGHGLDVILGQQGEQSLPVAHVGLDHAEVAVGGQPPLVGPLARRVIVVVEVVEADDRVATAQQALGQMAADETGRAGDQNRHTLILSISVGRMSSMTSCRLVVPCQWLTPMR